MVVHTPDELPALPGVESIHRNNATAFHLQLAQATSTQDILRSLVESGIHVDQFEIATPTLDEIFIRVVQQNSHLQGEVQ